MILAWCASVVVVVAYGLISLAHRGITLANPR